MHNGSDEYLYFEEANPGIIPRVGTNLKILDVGCGYGCLGEAMTAKGNRVFGVDLSPAAVEKAKRRLHFAAVADVTKPETWPEEIRQGGFDLVVLADILEHLPHPPALLHTVRPLLKRGGSILASIPNVANWATRLQLLAGRWTYATSGVLDRSHLRFFTLRTARRLLQDAGFAITGISVTPYILRAFAEAFRALLFKGSEGRAPADPTALVKSPYYRFYMRFLYPVELLLATCWKTMFAFQFIITATDGRWGEADTPSR